MFEIHLTVQTDNVEQFKTDCATAGVKPIVIDLQETSHGKVIQQDVMTSSRYKDGLAVTKLRELTKQFEDLGYTILRKKVEVDPVFNNIERVSGPTEYFESHIRFKLNKLDEGEAILRWKCKKHGFHVSRNIFKKIDANNYFLMATGRMYNTSLTTFKETLDNFLAALEGFTYDKVEVECCVFDSHSKHDNSWINGSN